MLKLFNKTIATNEYMDYQFIQKSIIPTLHFQSALPRLPIPELHLTCERYLAAQRILLIDELYKKTESNVNQFINGIGKELQKMLQHSNNLNKHTSYITDIWFDRYLNNRCALPLNSNPMLVLNDDEKSEYNDQLIRATNLIISSLRFYKSLKSNLLEPEVYHLNPRKSDNQTFRLICSKLPSKLAYIVAYLNKAYPLDMSQYPNLFNTTRLAKTDKDVIFNVSEAKHITVQHNGLFYFFNVLTDNGDILPANEILKKLNFIIKQEKTSEFSVGVLTSLERNKWAKIRHNLCENNQRSMEIIDSSLFNVCLDNDKVGEDPRALTRNFLHGNGTNRWFDKSFSLIISRDGVAGINFEHSWGDGVAVLRYAQDIYKDSTTNPQVHPNDATNEQNCSDSVHLLELHLNDNLKNTIIEAKNEYNNTCNSLDINYLIFEGIGKSICKENSISPDAVMQLAFQVGYNKMTGTFASTYESCSTAAFKHGRTETIRPLTMPVKNFTLLNNSGKQGHLEELKKMIQECSQIHLRLIKEAAMGQGFDRHLFALKNVADKKDIKCHLFDDPAYQHINYDVLSTSTLNSPVIKAGGFGPTVPDGLGIGYTIKDNDLGLLVTSYKGKQNGADFVEAVKKSFEEILMILRFK